MFGRTQDETHDETHTDHSTGRHEADPTTRGEVLAREREEHGGLKIGSAFFGWLTATGMAVLLSALVAVTGLLASDATGTDTASEVSDALDIQVESLGLLGIVVALTIMFIAYYSGGYVAGRMARFDGFRQGIAVWVIGLVVVLVLAAAGAIAGAQYNVLQELDLPRIPIDEGTATTGGIVTLVAILLATLLGAMLGGKLGDRYHRKVDRAGFPA